MHSQKVCHYWRFAHPSSLSDGLRTKAACVTLNEGSLGFPAFSLWSVTCPSYKYSLLCLFLTFASFALQIFTLSSTHPFPPCCAFSSPSLRSSSLLRAPSKFLLLPSSSCFVFFPYRRNHNFRGHFLLNNGLFLSFVLRGFFGHIQDCVWCSQGCGYRLLSSGRYRNPQALWNQYNFLPSYVNP